MTRFSWSTFDLSRKLSAEEATELAARVAELTKAGLPLGAGLRALAGELSSKRLRRVLQGLADRLDAGEDLAVAVDALGRRLPPYLRGLMLAGLRSGRLAEVLEEYVDLERSQAEMRRRVTVSLVYPFVLLTMLTGMAVVARLCIVDDLIELIRGGPFGYGYGRPSAASEIFIDASRPTMWTMVAVFAAFSGMAILSWLVPHARCTWQMLHGLPMIGPLCRWSHLAQFTRLMGMLLEQQVPLPDALRLTSAGLRDANLAWGCRRVADEVDNGRALDDSLAGRPQFPPSMIPVVGWGQRASTLADAFRAAAEVFEGRVRSQAALIEAVLPPVMFMAVVAFAGMFVLAVMLPIISMIRAFMYWC